MSARVVGYVFRAEILCPPCTIHALPTGPGEPFDGWALAPGASPMTAEANLDELATVFGIDRADEASFDSGDFPKVILSTTTDPETCGSCLEEL